MHNMAKVPVPSEDIFSTTVSGQPKSEILVDLQRQHRGLTYHFVEDKLGTLEKASISASVQTDTSSLVHCPLTAQFLQR